MKWHYASFWRQCPESVSTNDTSAFHEDLPGPPHFPFLSWRSPVGASNLPEDAIHRLQSLSFLQNGSEELAPSSSACPNWLPHLTAEQTITCFFYPLSCPSRAVSYLKGLEELEFGVFHTRSITADGIVRGILRLKVLGRTWQQGDQLGSRRQDAVRKLHMRTEALYSTWWRKTLGNTRNRHWLMLLSTFSAS